MWIYHHPQTLGTLLMQSKADIMSGVMVLGLLGLNKDVTTVVGWNCMVWLASLILIDVGHQNNQKNLGILSPASLMVEFILALFSISILRDVF